MSKESLTWLNENTLVGYTDKRGNAWHHREGTDNHFPGAIPVETVRERLFDWDAVPSRVYVDAYNGEDLVPVPNKRGEAWYHLPVETVRGRLFAWDAVPSPVYVDADFVPVPNKTAWKRSDTGHVMGIFSDGYQGHGYQEWLINNVGSILDTGAGELAIGSAGLLKGGAVAWVQVEMEDTVKTVEGFDFRPFLLATTSFDGTVATQYGRKIQAVVCDNTLEMAQSERDQSFKLRHTKNSGLKLDEARDALAIIYAAADDFAAEVKALTEQTVTDAQWAQFLDAHAPVPTEEGRGKTVAEKHRESLSELWLHDDRVSPWKNTALGVLQAVNTYNTHVATIRKTARQDRVMQNVISGKMGENDRNALTTLGAVLANA
jgi:phage/plasmid-like protein (TIGR03299 family)